MCVCVYVCVLCNFLITLSLLLPALLRPVHSRANYGSQEGCRKRLITSASEITGNARQSSSSTTAAAFKAKSFGHVSAAELQRHIRTPDSHALIVLIMFDGFVWKQRWNQQLLSDTSCVAPVTQSIRRPRIKCIYEVKNRKMIMHHM